MINESVALAAKSDVAVIFVGQPEYAESEMRDLKGIDLPEQQILLIQAIATVQPKCIVVTSSGTALAMRPGFSMFPLSFTHGFPDKAWVKRLLKSCLDR